MLSELDVVNECLSTVGELGLVELDDDHPMVAPARRYLRLALIAEMHKAWWFNTDYENLRRANDNFVYVPQDAVAVYPVFRADLAMRGRRLWNRFKSTYEVEDSEVYSIITRDLPFEDLPSPAQLLVKANAVLGFQKEFDGDESRYRKLQTEYQSYVVYLNAEHIRQVKFNGLETMYVGLERLKQSRNQSGSYRGNGIRVR